MRISDEALNEFVDLYKIEFGEDISRNEASEMATSILTLYTLLSKKPPMSGNSGGATEATTNTEDAHSRDGFQI